MPWGDGTGPVGMGPMTGRAGGYCAGFNMPGFANPIPRRGRGLGRGLGRGFGRGLGMRRGFGWAVMPYQNFEPPIASAPDPYAQIGVDEEKQMLQREAQNLRESLSNIEQRLKDLENKEDKE